MSGSDESPATPELSVIIVSWNVRELLADCLGSLEPSRDSLDLEVIVVDGGSQDGSPELVRESFPWVRLLAHADNVGFPKGNNLGISVARGRALLLLNPDTEVIGDALATMLSYLDEHPGVGIVGPQLRYPDGRVQSSRRRFPTVATAFLESTWLEPWAPRTVLKRYRVLDRTDDMVTDVDWIVGAALMARREAVEAVGLLDEAYYMYSEDLDWCRRFKDAGWRIVYLPEAQIIHHEGKSSEQAVTARHINFQRAKLRYFRKYHGRAVCALLRAFLILSYTWQIILEGTKGALGHRRQLRWQRVASYWQVLRSGLGPAGY